MGLSRVWEQNASWGQMAVHSEKVNSFRFSSPNDSV